LPGGTGKIFFFLVLLTKGKEFLRNEINTFFTTFSEQQDLAEFAQFGVSEKIFWKEPELDHLLLGQLLLEHLLLELHLKLKN
jgi:hypothetical protein